MKRMRLTPNWIALATFLAPFSINEYWSIAFDYGFMWRFPLWVIVHGHGESGPFVRVGPNLGEWVYFPLSAIASIILIVTGVALAKVVHLARDEDFWFQIAKVSVIAAMMIQILTVFMFTAAATASGFMIGMVVPLPLPSLIAIVILYWRSRALQPPFAAEHSAQKGRTNPTGSQGSLCSPRCLPKIGE